MFDDIQYFPALSTRTHEQLAYAKCSASVKDRMVPIVTLTRYDKEETLEETASILLNDLDGRPAIVDFDPLPRAITSVEEAAEQRRRKQEVRVASGEKPSRPRSEKELANDAERRRKAQAFNGDINKLTHPLHGPIRWVEMISEFPELLPILGHGTSDLIRNQLNIISRKGTNAALRIDPRQPYASSAIPGSIGAIRDHAEALLVIVDVKSMPLICIKPPKPCNMRALAIELLTAMRVPVKGRKTDPELWVFLKEQLRERGVKAIWIDEMQDVLRNNTPKAIQAIQDVLKALVQIDGWPIHTIYSGVPALATFLQGDRQLARRSYVMRYEPMEFPDDAEWIEKIIAGVVLEDCGMSRADDTQTDVFREKLCRAASGAFGQVVEFVQDACFRAVDSGRTQVKLADFMKVYEEMTGCTRRDNVFVAANWREIVPANALDDIAPPVKSRRAA